MRDDDHSSNIQLFPKRPAATLALLEQEWWKLSQNNRLPRRRDVSAATLGAALPHGFIIERIAPGHARLRVAGQRISDFLGTEARAMPLSVLMSAGSRPKLAELLNQVFDRACIVDLPIEGVRRLSLKRLPGRLLLLPLLDDHGEVTRAMGALVFDEGAPDGPLRCTVSDRRAPRVEPFRYANAGLEVVEGDRHLPTTRRASEAPWLRLVIDNGPHSGETLH